MSSTLKMDIAAAMAVKTKIDSSSEEITNQWRLLNQRMDEFIQMDWKGDSARQFNDIFKQFVEVELIRLQELKQLSAKLDNEIAQWQETGAGLGMG